MSVAVKRAPVQEDLDDLAVFAERATEPTLSFESALKELKRMAMLDRAMMLSRWSLGLFFGAMMAALAVGGEWIDPLRLIIGWGADIRFHESLAWLTPRGLWIAATVCGVGAFFMAPDDRRAVTWVAFAVSMSAIVFAFGGWWWLPRVAY
ncbi:MAG: hypothetical protein WC708_17335 [Lentisphaeria bacterium]